MKLYFGFCLYLATILVADSNKKTPRLVNGNVAQEDQFPWQVGVVTVRDSTVLNYCGGALICENWVLTAAHCIYQVDRVIVFHGTLDLQDPNNNVSVTNYYVIHPDYDNTRFSNDIGLIFLNYDLDFNDKVKPIALADTELEAGTEVTISGWGNTGDDPSNDSHNVLRYVSVDTIDNEECLEVYGPGVITPSVVCTEAGNPVKKPCDGDGGDPAVVNPDTNPVHVALFSFSSSYGCENPDFPVGFTRTAYYRDWIREVTGV